MKITVNPGMIFSDNFKGAMEDYAKNGKSTEKGERARRYMQTAVQAFMQGSNSLGLANEKYREAKIQAFTSSADIPDPQYAFDSFVKIANWDNLYENSFKLRQFNPMQGFFSIVTINGAGFAFAQLPQGGSVSVKRYTGDEVLVKAITYADGLGWYEEMIEDRDFSGMVEQLNDMTNNFFASKSTNYYRLITDAGFDTSNGNASVAWQGSGAILERDRLTISKMANDIAVSVKNSGYGNVATAQYDVYCQPIIAPRLKDALNGQLGAANGVGNIPAYNIRVNPTFNLNRSAGAAVAATDAIMVLSGNKIQRGDKIALEARQTYDTLSASHIVVGRARYGGAVADPKQTIKGAFA